jgi:chromate transporter
MKAGMKSQTEIPNDSSPPSWKEVSLYFLMLGFINIGGPVAQITMMYHHMVEKRHWLSKERFVQIMAFCHMLPGPEALQLAIYVGYLKRRFWGGILAGLTFILPGAVVMVVLSWLYVKYGNLPPVNDFLYVLKPAVLGIIAAGIIKLTRASIRNLFLAVLLIGAFLSMRFAGINFLLILLVCGLVNLVATEGWVRFRRTPATLPSVVGILGLAVGVTAPQWFQMAWLFLKTGLFSFGGAYASLAFLQQGDSRTISLAVGSPTAGRSGTQCCNTRPVYAVHNLRRFCGRWIARCCHRDLLCVFTFLCLRAWRRALR